MKSNKETLIKIIILAAVIIFFGRLTLSGDILTFVHPRLVPFIKFSLILMIIICMFYILEMKRNDKKHVNLKGYRIFIIPLLLAFCINPAEQIKNVKAEKNTIDSSSVVRDNSKDDSEDSSSENSGDAIVINDDNYLDTLSKLRKNIDDYNGREIELAGFIYKDENITGKDFVCARYMMVCCAADMQVVGILCKDNSGRGYNADEWVKVKGIIRKSIDAAAADIMYIEVQSAENIAAPKDAYVYPK